MNWLHVIIHRTWALRRHHFMVSAHQILKSHWLRIFPPKQSACLPRCQWLVARDEYAALTAGWSHGQASDDMEQACIVNATIWLQNRWWDAQQHHDDDVP